MSYYEQRRAGYIRSGIVSLFIDFHQLFLPPEMNETDSGNGDEEQGSCDEVTNCFQNFVCKPKFSFAVCVAIRRSVHGTIAET